MFPKELMVKIHNASKILRSKGLKISSAESCTGGLVSAAFTEIPGSSEIFERGFTTYSNEAKIELLTVPTFFIEDYGAVSKEVALAMAEGALLVSKSDIAVSVTGIAGPEGGSEEKPVGTVFIGLAKKGKNAICKKYLFNGNREAVRLQSVDAIIDLLLDNL